MAPTGKQALLEALVSLAQQAGEAILDVYRTDFAVRQKADVSPVTEADERAESLLLAGLARLEPGVACVSEEAAARNGAPQVSNVFWLVDPLDGTREFISRNGEFTVNIALIEEGVPTLGVVLAPALGVAYLAAKGHGAHVESRSRRHPVRVAAPSPDEGLVVVSSRSHADEAALGDFLAGRRVAATRGIGSSLKFCLVAEGQAHLYPRLGPTMEWDTAAGHAVLAEAGGFVRDLQGDSLRYGKPAFRNPHFVAGCGPAVDR